MDESRQVWVFRSFRSQRDSFLGSSFQFVNSVYMFSQTRS